LPRIISLIRIELWSLDIPLGLQWLGGIFVKTVMMSRPCSGSQGV
jgi:hypothetical protein